MEHNTKTPSPLAFTLPYVAQFGVWAAWVLTLRFVVADGSQTIVGWTLLPWIVPIAIIPIGVWIGTWMQALHHHKRPLTALGIISVVPVLGLWALTPYALHILGPVSIIWS